MLRAKCGRRLSICAVRRGALVLAVASLWQTYAYAGTAISWDRQAYGQSFTDSYTDDQGNTSTYDYTWPDNANWSQSALVGQSPISPHTLTYEPSNWSLPNYPDGDYDVSLGGNQVTLDISVSVDSLSMSGELDILGDRSLDITQGSLVNNGSIIVNWDDSAYGAALDFTADANIGGTGTIVLNNDGAGSQLNVQAGSTVTIGPAETVSGLGQTSGSLINNGTINANVAASTLLVQGDITNNNILSATSGGTLYLSSTISSSNTGTISCDATSTLVVVGTEAQSSTGKINVLGNLILSTGTIDGGTLDASASGASIQVNSGDGLIQNNTFTLGAGNHLDIYSDFNLTFAGTMALTNNGIITVNSNQGAYGSAINFDSNITVNGTGSILLNEDAAGASLIADPGATVTLASGQTLHGMGQINAAIINYGTISADVSGASLDIGTFGMENDNLMQANNSSTMNIGGITVNNTSGTISASNKSVVSMSDATIVGGVVSATSDSHIDWVASTITGAITLSGTQNIPSDATLTMNGTTLTNNGTIVINPEQGVYGTALDFDSDATLDGTGEILLNGAGGTSQLNVINGHTLTIQSDQSIVGIGQITGNFINYGQIAGNVSGQTLEISPGTATSNYGDMTGARGGTLQIDSGQVNNYGLISCLAGATLSLGTTYITNYSTGGIAVSGALILNGATIDGGTIVAGNT
ncbi:MAG TPA: hypothetical protein VGG19_20105, partial [Tepidisphaeraceae bacterium]